MAKIKIRYSMAAGATAPVGLTAGELAVNITQRRMFVGDTAGNTIELAGLSANNFTGLNSFAAGISAAGGVTFAGSLSGTTATFSRVLTAPSIAFNSPSATISGFSASGAYPKAIFDGNWFQFQVIAGPWALGLQEENSLGYPYDTSIIANPNTGIISIEAQTIFSNASQFTLLGGISAGDSSTFNGALTGTTASFSRLLTATQGISAAGATFSGSVTAPTPSPGTNNTQVATTAFVQTAVSSGSSTNVVTSFNGRTGAVQGVSAAVAGSGISVSPSGGTGTVTIASVGVGDTGAVQFRHSGGLCGSAMQISGRVGGVTLDSQTEILQFGLNRGPQKDKGNAEAIGLRIIRGYGASPSSYIDPYTGSGGLGDELGGIGLLATGEGSISGDPGEDDAEVSNLYIMTKPAGINSEFGSSIQLRPGGQPGILVRTANGNGDPYSAQIYPPLFVNNTLNGTTAAFSRLVTASAGISAAGGVTLAGSLSGTTAAFSRLVTFSQGISAAGGVTLAGSLSGTTAAFSRLVTFNQGISAANGVTLHNASLTGIPTAPTANVGTNTTQIATTAFVLANSSSTNVVKSVNGRTGDIFISDGQGISFVNRAGDDWEILPRIDYLYTTGLGELVASQEPYRGITFAIYEDFLVASGPSFIPSNDYILIKSAVTRNGDVEYPSQMYLTTLEHLKLWINGAGMDPGFVEDEALFVNGITVGGTAAFQKQATFNALTQFNAGISASGGMTLDGGKVWHSLNDGPTSGLDAGQLYGVTASLYASSLSTGLLYGGLVTINAGNSAAFDVSAGAGYIVTTGATFTAEPNPVITRVSWTAKTGVTLSGLTAQDTTWIYFDSSGNLNQQPAFFTDDQVQSTLAVGALVHPSRAYISLAKTIPNVSYATDKQYEQFIRAFGPLKVSGHSIQANGANLKLNRTSGTAFILGRNYPNDPNNPSVISDNAQTDCTFWRYYRGATAGSFVTVLNQTAIDPENYDDGTGTLNSVPSNKPFTIQRLFFFPGTPSVLGVYYGHASYASISEAANNVNFEDFTEITNTATNAVFAGYLLVKKGTTNLTTAIAADDARIIQSGQFRSTTSGGGTIATNLDSLNDVTISSVQDDDLLIYDTATSQWLNTPLQHIGVTRVNGLSGAVQAVSSFNGRTGAVQGVSAAVAGDGITVSGATGAVTITNAGVTRAVAGTGISVNANTGTVTITNSGVTSLAAGTGVAVSAGTGAVTVTNIGVRSFNGATGAVTGASLGANTFNGLQTISSGGLFVNGGGTTFGASQGVVFEYGLRQTRVLSNIDNAGGLIVDRGTTLGSVGGAPLTVRGGPMRLLQNGGFNITTGNTSGVSTSDCPLTVTSAGNFTLNISPMMSTGLGTYPNLLVLAGNGVADGGINISGSDLILGTKSADGEDYTPVGLKFTGTSFPIRYTTLTANPSGSDKTITLPNATGTVALDAAANTFTALQSFTQGISAAGGVTFASNLAVNGGSITTSAATGNLFNTVATTLNIGGVATTTNLATVASGLTLNIATGANGSDIKNIYIGTGPVGGGSARTTIGYNGGVIVSHGNGITLSSSAGGYVVNIPSATTNITGTLNASGSLNSTGLFTTSGGLSASGGVTFNTPIVSTRMARTSSGVFDTRTGSFSPTEADNGKIFVINISGKTSITVTLEGLSTGWRAKFLCLGGATSFSSTTGNVFGSFGANGSGFQSSTECVEVHCYASNTYHAS
jgi:hypothetical protein